MPRQAWGALTGNLQKNQREAYIERETHIEVWRVLNGERDIPSWLESNDGEVYAKFNPKPDARVNTCSTALQTCRPASDASDAARSR